MLVGDLLLLNEGMIEFLVRVKHWEEGSRMVVVEEQSHPSLTETFLHVYFTRVGTLYYCNTINCLVCLALTSHPHCLISTSECMQSALNSAVGF